MRSITWLCSSQALLLLLMTHVTFIVISDSYGTSWPGNYGVYAAWPTAALALLHQAFPSSDTVIFYFLGYLHKALGISCSTNTVLY